MALWRGVVLQDVLRALVFPLSLIIFLCRPRCWSAGDLPEERTCSWDLKMVGKAVGAWWNIARPYYTKAYQEVLIGIPIVGYFYYKLSYGGKKAVKDSKSSGHH